MWSVQMWSKCFHHIIIIYHSIASKSLGEYINTGPVKSTTQSLLEIPSYVFSCMAWGYIMGRNRYYIIAWCNNENMRDETIGESYNNYYNGMDLDYNNAACMLHVCMYVCEYIIVFCIQITALRSDSKISTKHLLLAVSPLQGKHSS